MGLYWHGNDTKRLQEGGFPLWREEAERDWMGKALLVSLTFIKQNILKTAHTKCNKTLASGDSEGKILWFYHIYSPGRNCIRNVPQVYCWGMWRNEQCSGVQCSNLNTTKETRRQGAPLGREPLSSQLEQAR